MAKVQRFEDLICWQKARILVREIYKVTERQKFCRDFDLKSQIRRAAISVMNNIAEGFGRFSKKEFVRFLEISSTSASEVKSALYVAFDLEYCDQLLIEGLQSKAEEVKRLNLSFIRYLNTQIRASK
jgi:four helix bundle protein